MVKLLMVPLVIACYLLYAVENTYTAENGKSEYRAWLEIEADNSHLEIKAYCRNNSSENSVLKYELKAQKKEELEKQPVPSQVLSISEVKRKNAFLGWA